MPMPRLREAAQRQPWPPAFVRFRARPGVPTPDPSFL